MCVSTLTVAIVQGCAAVTSAALRIMATTDTEERNSGRTVLLPLRLADDAADLAAETKHLFDFAACPVS